MGTASTPPDGAKVRALPGGRCPRCGGAGRPPRRRANPFLSKAPAPGALVCDDCGLDFEGEAPDSRPPWAT